jgi:hypothetical protein
VPATEDWQPGDQIIYLLHDPRPNLLKRLSGASPSSPLALEKLPQVEEVPISAPVSQTTLEEIVNPPKKELLQPPASG